MKIRQKPNLGFTNYRLIYHNMYGLRVYLDLNLSPDDPSNEKAWVIRDVEDPVFREFHLNQIRDTLSGRKPKKLTREERWQLWEADAEMYPDQVLDLIEKDREELD